MYVQFHPDMYRLPRAVLAATDGGARVVAPVGYVMYYVLPSPIG
jgi:hypothetical protein